MKDNNDLIISIQPGLTNIKEMYKEDETIKMYESIDKILSDLNKYITLYNRIQYTYDNRITTSILPKDYNINSPAAYSDPGSYMGLYHGLCGGLMPPILSMTRERSHSDS